MLRVQSPYRPHCTSQCGLQALWSIGCADDDKCRDFPIIIFHSVVIQSRCYRQHRISLTTMLSPVDSGSSSSSAVVAVAGFIGRSTSVLRVPSSVSMKSWTVSLRSDAAADIETKIVGRDRLIVLFQASTFVLMMHKQIIKKTSKGRQ